MPLSQFFTLHAIKGKDVYVVDDHHKALAAWALVRRSMTNAPNLVTIDHHTDTHEAFLGHVHWEAQVGHVKEAEQTAFRLKLVEQIDWRSDQSIIDAISKLRYDEHIDAATCSGTLNNAFCIQLSDSDPTPSVEQLAYDKSRGENWPNPPAIPEPQRPMTYTPAPNRIYGLPFGCFIGCQAKPHDDACELQQSNEIIESNYLDDQLARGAEISSCIGLAHLEAAPYILDIDLDAFHTRKAISPEDSATFYRLIKNATAITIATEAQCVEELWLDEDDVMGTHDLLTALLAHIDRAL